MDIDEHPGCWECIYYDPRYSDLFGECPVCLHDPQPFNLDEVFDFEELCEFHQVKEV